jgi:hypothetical protein
VISIVLVSPPPEIVTLTVGAFADALRPDSNIAKTISEKVKTIFFMGTPERSSDALFRSERRTLPWTC